MKNCHSPALQGALRPYNKGMKNETTMTLTEANTVWTACYGDDLNSDGWDRYTSAQRQQAIDVRDAHANGGQWGFWDISDRH
jgi:hypothetical protein